MAEKMANSIGRELRYFEYKFRKKQSTKKNKKNKPQGPGPELAWSDSPQNDEFRYQSEDMKKALPSNKNEEDLQIQVALAMSREEEKERERQQESDKIRLQMAIKESSKETTKPNQTTLLDLAERPPRVSAPVPTVSAGAPFASTATNDPWGAAAAPAPPATFDPFAPPPVQASFPAGTATDGFGMANGNAWAAPSAPAAPPSTSMDPWGTPASTAAPVPVAAFPAAAANDPWGAQSAAMQPQAEPVYATVQKDTWKQDLLFSTQASAIPATLPTIPPLQNGNAWDPLPSTTPATTNAFGVTPAAAFPTQQSTFDTPPAFDPLKDFDSLHIGGKAEPSPVLLHKDFGAGQNASVAKDIFPVGQLLEPEPVAKSQSMDFAQPQGAQKATTADQFLGENSNLVNLSSWQTYQVPYVTKPLGTQSHNPFAQTGPQKTLNEMRGGNQQTFAQPAFH